MMPYTISVDVGNEVLLIQPEMKPLAHWTKDFKYFSLLDIYAHAFNEEHSQSTRQLRHMVHGLIAASQSLAAHVYFEMHPNGTYKRKLNHKNKQVVKKNCTK
jgi:hypothetical protein